MARLDDFAPAAIHELGPDDAPLWRVFFQVPADRDAASAALRREHGVACSPIDVPDEDWAARSQSQLRAVRIGRIVVAPPWDTPRSTRSELHNQDSGPGVASASDVLVIIRPSMGFGTGHHETTRLCLELLQTLDLTGCRVLDVGTGSGVLAISAALLGAASVHAIDVDEDALGNARENAVLNEGSLSSIGASIAFSRCDLRDITESADVLVANLTGGLLVSAAAALTRAVRVGGQLLVSGFQPQECDTVLDALAPAGARVEQRREGQWEAALIAR